MAILALVLAQAWAVPARAQSLLRDAETEKLFRDMGEPLMQAAGLDPRAVTINLVGANEINAFATLGQGIYFYSGLIIAADDVLEVQGVLAHELGHVAGGHAVRFNEGAGPATNISLLSLVIGAALLAAGAGDAGMAAMMAGQQAAQGKFLAFSREQESRTDQAGAQFLEKAGVDGHGMISFFRELQGQEYRLAIPQDNSYNRTHPLSGERIAALEDVLQRSPAWGKGADPVLQARYQRVRAKLIGYLSEPADTLRAYPPGDTSAPARVARAYAFHKLAEPEKAVSEVDALLKTLPDDPYLLELKGQVLLESGHVKEAIPPLRQAVRLSNGNPLIAGMLGHALVQTSEREHDDAMLDEAEKVLRSALARDDDNPFAWLQLETVYERKGDKPRLALATAERLTLSGGDPRAALNSAMVAAQGLPQGTPEWIRAQDIVQFSRNRAEDMKKKGRNDR
ncbi:M48 family metalloprotease [Sandaracinobacter sp. RS1-74]|uniref:M48 family metalloprotease n=1 Tax=Sandaracinobacteroides sayramensis TaxID=2913411 RepID=UPI001EDB7FFA|nr:M48 family metalloprotease [Sandaracinobacteroides sayramensis]MCG2839681.1 M48 family metalloprotease [Sandaracinobacteroides sayramensis]